MKFFSPVPRHELIMALVFGAIFGVLGYYLTRAIGPKVDSLVTKAGG